MHTLSHTSPHSCTCMHTYTHTHTCAHTLTIHAYMHTHMLKCRHTPIDTHAHTQTYRHTTHTYAYNMFTHIYTSHTHRHTHKHTQGTFYRLLKFEISVSQERKEELAQSSEQRKILVLKYERKINFKIYSSIYSSR